MSASGGCGCGGSSAAIAVKGGSDCGGSCGCGGGASCGCEVSLTGEGFVRPRFFGGMLLTEDDLQAAVDYALAKRKLTNRYVIGDGVVCGLEVSCHPCDPRKVQISPGYAIECCGNDILVSCPEEVDVIDLVRDLRLRQGIDCGEPCERQPRDHYYLYVRYAELPTAPVAPYAADDCATGECEFSRIREGYCFELRCDPPDDAPSVIDALRACRPDEQVLASETRTMERVVDVATTFAAAAKAAAEGQELTLAAPVRKDFDDLAIGGDVKLDEGVALLIRATHTLALAAAGDKGEAPPQRLNRARRAVIAERSVLLAAQLRESAELKAQPVEERRRIERILETAEQQPDLSALGALDRAMLLEGTTVLDAEREYLAGAELMRRGILRRLGSSGRATCDEYRKVSAMRFDGLSESSEQDAAVLARAHLRSIAACTCTAFDPPCATCTDDAVVLAKVRVDGCEVIDVCSLERRWVLSPRALGYWFPVVDTFRRCLEEFCCESSVDAGRQDDPLRCMGAALEDAASVFRQAFSGSFTTQPALSALRERLGEPVAPTALRADTAATPPAATTSTTAGASAEHTSAATEAKLSALEATVAALSRQLDELKAAGEATEEEER